LKAAFSETYDIAFFLLMYLKAIWLIYSWMTNDDTALRFRTNPYTTSSYKQFHGLTFYALKRPLVSTVRC